MTNLNDAFEHELAQEDEEYGNGSERVNIPTPLCKALWLIHGSMQ